MVTLFPHHKGCAQQLRVIAFPLSHQLNLILQHMTLWSLQNAFNSCGNPPYKATFPESWEFFAMSNDTFFKLLIERKGYLAASSLSGKAVGKNLAHREALERPAEHHQWDTFPSIK